MENKSFSIFTDGAARGNPGLAAAAFLLVREGVLIHSDSSFLGTRTNNQAEYQAIIIALENAKKFTKGSISIYSDSELVIKQLNGEYQVKNPQLKILHKEVMKKTRYFSSIKFVHLPRTNPWIKKADKLCNEILSQKKT
jgi:ribonuclease HI